MHPVFPWRYTTWRVRTRSYVQWGPGRGMENLPLLGNEHRNTRPQPFRVSIWP
jgi:hypothetical protein